MIAKTYSIIPTGYTGAPIEIEGDLSNGLPGFNIVGMANKAVSEARERVKSALKSSGFSFPDKKLTINLAPADLEKSGTGLDLAIALNILILSGALRQEDVEESAFIGELSLDGNIRPVTGIINIVETARDQGLKTVFLPVKNFTQATLIRGIKIIGVKNLVQLFSHLKKQKLIRPLKNVVKNTKTDVEDEKVPNFTDISGQALAKRALTIAISGHHNILLSGPPGTGKTMLARSALSLLPPLTPAEQISITKLHSLAGTTSEIVCARPFRSPHHTSSQASLIGGGPKAMPGEISLAHLGVLFLDELPEYPRNVIESLRQPLEDRQISVLRANKRVSYPADFMLVATMNPCPCGYYGDPDHPCSCTESQIRQYQKKLSGPLLDRIDLFVEVNRIKPAEIIAKSAPDVAEDSATREKIAAALGRQRERYQNETTYNASLTSSQITRCLTLAPEARTALDRAAEALNLSARSYFKTIKVARTIADLDQTEVILPAHILEAISFRQPTPKEL